MHSSLPTLLPSFILLDHILLQPDSSDPVEEGGSGVELGVLLGILARKKLC